jgi:hypothetical protein
MARRDPTADALRDLRFLERDPSLPDAEANLKRALTNRANIVVARAAPLVASLGLRALVPDLEKAFEYFRITPSATRSPSRRSKSSSLFQGWVRAKIRCLWPNIIRNSNTAASPA